MADTNDEAPPRRPLGRAKAKAAERNAEWRLDVSTYLERAVRLFASPRGGPERSSVALEIVNLDEVSAKAPDKPAGELAEELRLACKRIVAKLDQLPSVRRLDSLDDHGMLVLDGLLVAEMQKIGDCGKATAKRLAERARQRGAALPVKEGVDLLTAPTDDDRLDPLYWWHLDRPRGILALADSLWRDEVLPRLKNPAALVRPAHTGLTALFSSARREEEATGQRALLLGEPLVRLATVGLDAMQALRSARGLKLFGTVPAHRALRYLVFEGHRLAIARDPDPRMLEYSSWSTFVRDCLHDHSKAAVEKYRSILWAMHSTDLVLPKGQTTRLLSLTDRKNGRGPGDRFQIVLGTVLLPNYVHELQRVTGGPREKLIPWLPMPPFVGRERDHGAQANLQWHLLLALRDRADELVNYGGVALSAENLGKLARDSGLPLTLVPKVIERWTRDGDDGPAVLKETERGIYTLGDHYARERDFLEEGGRMSLDGARNGRLAAEKRKRARERTRKDD